MSLAVPMGGTLVAQAGTKDTKATQVPESAMPPAGMCRVWLRDVPERQQPAPTDCATAIKTMPRNAQVLFGDLKRAASVAAPGSASPTLPSMVREPSAFRGMGGNNGELRRSAAQAAAMRAGAGRVGTVGISASALVATPGAEPTATKAPATKPVIKPEIPQ